MKKKLFLISLAVIFLDRIIKLLVISKIAYSEVNNIITNFFYLTNVHNYGAAWSILSGNRLFLIIISLISLIVIYMMFINKVKLNNFKMLSFGLLIGGIIGNLLDRIFLGYVIDYLGFIIINYRFPIFNLADIEIVISVILIAYQILKEGETNEWNKSRYW